MQREQHWCQSCLWSPAIKTGQAQQEQSLVFFFAEKFQKMYFVLLVIPSSQFMEVKLEKETQTDRLVLYITLTCHPEWRHLLCELIGKHKVCVGSQMESTGGYLLPLSLSLTYQLDWIRGSRQSAQEPILGWWWHRGNEGACRICPHLTHLSSIQRITSVLDAISPPPHRCHRKSSKHLHCLRLTVPPVHTFLFSGFPSLSYLAGEVSLALRLPPRAES